MNSRGFFWLAGVVGLYFYLNLFNNALIDDAFITLNYVKTILNSHTWGIFPNHIANTATSPLNVLLLSLIGLFIGVTAQVPIWLTLIALSIIAFTLTRISLRLFNTERFGLLIFLALTFNPLLISTMGLEGLLFTTLFIISIYCYLARQWILLAVTLGLLTITRTEGVLFFGVFLLFIPSKQLKWQSIAIYCLTIAPWHLFSWIYLGSFIPDTLFIKKAQVSWSGWNFFNGAVFYYQHYPLEVLLSLIFLPGLLLLFNKRIRKMPILLIIALCGLVHFVGYSLLQVPPYHWYYVPQIAALIVFGGLGLGVVHQCCRTESWQKKAVQGTVVLYALIPALGMASVLSKQQFVVKEMPIHSNWATHEQYKAVGLWLKDQPIEQSILLNGEVGTLAFYCDCYLLDMFGDRRSFKENVTNKLADKSIKSWLYHFNFLFLADTPAFPPYAYRLTGNTSRETTNNHLSQWKTTSKWIPEGSLVLDPY